MLSFPFSSLHFFVSFWIFPMVFHEVVPSTWSFFDLCSSSLFSCFSFPLFSPSTPLFTCFPGSFPLSSPFPTPSPLSFPLCFLPSFSPSYHCIEWCVSVIKALGFWAEKAMATHSSTLAWKIPWTEEPGGLQSMGSLRVGHHWATSLLLFTFIHWRRKWQPSPGFLPGESQGWGSLVGCHLWGRTELDTTEAT